MKLNRLAPPVAALAAAALFTATQTSEAFNLLGWSLGPAQRDFRVYNTFTDAASNNNQTPDPNFPGAQGAVMAIWKASIEWSSVLHGDGQGDPHQVGGLGSGGANFDPSFQGEANEVGNLGENIHSPLAGSSGGVLAFAENNGTGLWRIRYFEGGITWNDGPGASIAGGHFDLQSVACHEYGHALGLDHSTFGTATMAPSIGNGSVSERSISNDDRNGIQAIYGAISPGKPLITSVALAGTNLTINGSNFSATGNTIWFTRENFVGNGTVLTVNNVASTNGGTLINVTVPGNARSGDVLVRNTLGGGQGISNAWPLDLDGPPCPDPVTFCNGAPNSVSLAGGVIQVTGSQDTTVNDTVLTATDIPGGQFGIFIYSMGQASLPVGDGTLCISGPLFRLPPQSTGTGSMSLTLDFNNLPVGGDILPGEVWNFQAWFRDPMGGPNGSNLTSAQEVMFCD